MNWISLYSILAVTYCQGDPPDPDLDSQGSQEAVIFCTYEGFELECFDKDGISWSPGTWLGSLFDWKLLVQARIELDITQIKTQINPDGSSSSGILSSNFHPSLELTKEYNIIYKIYLYHIFYYPKCIILSLKNTFRAGRLEGIYNLRSKYSL